MAPVRFEMTEKPVQYHALRWLANMNIQNKMKYAFIHFILQVIMTLKTIITKLSSLYVELWNCFKNKVKL